MGKGLLLAGLKLVETTTDNNRYEFEFNTINNIIIGKGLSRLCSDYIFFLFSSYNKETGVGSNVKQLMGAPILRAADKNLTVVQIADEVDDTTERFRVLQTRSKYAVPQIEVLDTVRIISITIDTKKGSAIIVIEITNVLGQKAHIEL